jgi:hypothetical protein
VLYPLLSFALRPYASGAGFNPLAVKHRVLQIRQQPDYRGAHAMGPFYGPGINFMANRAHSGHIKKFELRI